jgi:hypothetical protein
MVAASSSTGAVHRSDARGAGNAREDVLKLGFRINAIHLRRDNKAGQPHRPNAPQISTMRHQPPRTR